MAFKIPLAPSIGTHINNPVTFHEEAAMRMLSKLATQIAGLARRVLSALVTFLVAGAIVPVRVAAVESQWLSGQAPGPADPTEALLVSSWHFMPRQPAVRSSPAPDLADTPD